MFQVMEAAPGLPYLVSLPRLLTAGWLLGDLEDQGGDEQRERRR
jgi:hypothetical protein